MQDEPIRAQLSFTQHITVYGVKAACKQRVEDDSDR